MARRIPQATHEDGSDRDPADKNNGAADRLLEAVTLLLIERGSALAAASLKPDEVTARAGKSRASYYRTEGFPGTDLATGEESRMAVLEAALRRSLHRSASQLDQVTGAIDWFIEEGVHCVSLAEFLRTTSLENFDTTANHDLVTQLLATALSVSSTRIADDVCQYYAEVTSTYAAQYGRLIDSIGFRVRPPFTAEDIAVSLMALAEGLAARSLADESITRGLYGDLIAHFAGSMVLAPGEGVDPLDPRHRMPTAPVTSLRRSEIIAHLVRMHEHDRDSLPTLEELAHRAGCSPGTITATFGSVVGVARAAWDEWMPEFAEAVERERVALHDRDPLTLLYRCCRVVAVRAAEHPALTRTVLMAEVGATGADAMRIDPVVELFASLLAEASAAGVFTPPIPPGSQVPHSAEHHFARSLCRTLLGLVVTSSTGDAVDAEEHGRACADYAWAVAMPPRTAPPGPSVV